MVVSATLGHPPDFVCERATHVKIGVELTQLTSEERIGEMKPSSLATLMSRRAG